MGFPWHSWTSDNSTMDWNTIGDSLSKYFGVKEVVCTVVIDNEVVAFSYEEMKIK